MRIGDFVRRKSNYKDYPHPKWSEKFESGVIDAIQNENGLIWIRLRNSRGFWVVADGYGHSFKQYSKQIK